jgi:hypothetical protein
MKIGLLSLDSKIKNIAIEKIRLFYQSKNIIVEDYNSFEKYDIVYISKIFNFTPEYPIYINSDKIIKGGSGYNIETKLPQEIEKMKPKINYGFITRGCVRNCEFCIVPQKEGKIYLESENLFYDFWDKKNKEIVIMDNNIFAMPNIFFEVCKALKKEKLKVDFNQGLDFRLLTDNICNELKLIKHKEYHFAFDYIAYKNKIIESINLLKKYNIKRNTWFIYCSEKNSFQECLERANILKQNNQNGFIQRNINIYYDKRYIALARWVNFHSWFQKISFFQFIKDLRNDYFKYFSREEITYIKDNQI